jgi:hypothetical protein
MDYLRPAEGPRRSAHCASNRPVTYVPTASHDTDSHGLFLISRHGDAGVPKPHTFTYLSRSVVRIKSYFLVKRTTTCLPDDKSASAPPGLVTITVSETDFRGTWGLR